MFNLKRVPGQEGNGMTKSKRKLLNKCRCPECLDQPNGETALLHRSINHLVATLDEKHRRQFAGLMASQLGHGGIQTLARITGLHRETIRRGKREIEQAEGELDGRIRTSGGGRHKAEKKSPAC